MKFRMISRSGNFNFFKSELFYVKLIPNPLTFVILAQYCWRNQKMFDKKKKLQFVISYSDFLQIASL